MSSINSRVPPLRLAAVDTPSDGQVAAYQSSSGQFEWVASGGGGTVTSVSSSQAFITITDPTTTPSISIGNASASSTGVLTSTDWNTFNNKGDGTVTSVSGTSPISSTGGTTPTISLDASGVVAGSYTYSALTVDATGRITAASSGSAPTIDGVGAATQVGIWADADTILGDADLTFDGSNLSVGGYVETGTKITTPSGTNLELVPGGASSGSIVIADGANGQISLNPNGTGTVKIDGVEIDNSAIATGYVLKATSTTAAGWAAESGGGITFPIEADSGTSSAPSYSFSADTDTGIYLSGASNMGIVAAGNSYLSIGSLGAVQFDRKALFNVATEAAPNGFSTDTNTGFFQAAADTLSLSNAGSETFRFGSNGEILIGGTAAGSSGQVLTSGGSGSAVSWTTVSSGGLKIPNSFGTTLTGTFGDGECLGLSFGLGAVGTVTPNTGTWANSLTRIRPHIMMQTGTLSTAKIWINAQPTGGVDQDWIIGLWNAGTDNKVGTLKATATITCVEGGSTGITSGTWTPETGQTLDVENGESYFIGFYSVYGSSSTAVDIYWCPQASITSYPARRPNANTGATSNVCRVYGSSGSPSSLGDNPTMTGADAHSTKAWPLMWYEVT